jgi:hypothetical protein
VTRAAQFVHGVRWWLSAALLGAAVFAGRWWGEQDLAAILRLPPGATVLVARQGVLVWTDPRDPQLLRWKRYPTPEQARLAALFPPPAPAVATTTVPTTTPPTTLAPSSKRRRP